MEMLIFIVIVVIAAITTVSILKNRHIALGSSTSLNVGPAAATPKRSRLFVADVLVRVHRLQSRNAQWAEISSELNPGNDPTVRQLLLDLRNDGLQFAPRDGLRKVELASEKLRAVPNADAETVLRHALGQKDVLDTFK